LLESAKEWLEKESAQWAFLDQVGPVAAPGPSLDAETDPRRLDEELRRLADLRARWDEVFGHLAMLFRAMEDSLHPAPARAPGPRRDADVRAG